MILSNREFLPASAKILANRLKSVIRTRMSKAHNAFVGGIQMLNASLIANEAIDSKLMSGGEKGILCKLDIQNACNHVN